MYDPCMQTINISLPIQLKQQADFLVARGSYASFSDLVRDSIRKLIEKNQYDLWAEEAKGDVREGTAIIADSDQDIDQFLNNS